MLTQEQRNDLRKRVLAGQPLTLEEAKEVFESVRQQQGAATIEAGEKKSRNKKPTMSDEELEASLANLGL